MFRRYNVYVDRYTKPGDVSTLIEFSRLDMTASVVRLFGGDVSDLLASTITHVIFNDDELGPEQGLIRLDEIKRTLQEYRLADPSVLDKKFVTAAWVTECVRAGRVLPERDFLPKSRGPPPPRPLSPVTLPNLPAADALAAATTASDSKRSSNTSSSKRSRPISPTSAPSDPANVFVPSTLALGHDSFTASSTGHGHRSTNGTTTRTLSTASAASTSSRTSVHSARAYHNDDDDGASSVASAATTVDTKRRRMEPATTSSSTRH